MFLVRLMAGSCFFLFVESNNFVSNRSFIKHFRRNAFQKISMILQKWSHSIHCMFHMGTMSNTRLHMHNYILFSTNLQICQEKLLVSNLSIHFCAHHSNSPQFHYSLPRNDRHDFPL